MSIAAFTMFMTEHIVRVHHALRDGGIPHAFGGAIANAFCGLPRATTDIDINIFLSESEFPEPLRVLEAIGVEVEWSRDATLIQRDGQIRLRWDGILVDLFFATFEFLESAGNRVKVVPFTGESIPVLSAEDLVVCKVAFNRDKDWLDLREIARVQGPRLDVAYIEHWLKTFGEDDPRTARFQALITQHG
ncbi:MAG: nucleotidyltransferase [Chloroflexi bacterium]|nr:nucleotidyltransferase [Chloroflexota bacterium]